MTDIEVAIKKLESLAIDITGQSQENPLLYDMYIPAIDTAIAALRRTAEHDKAMEEGRLVELPCKVGDDVFFNLWNVKSQKYETLPGTIKNVRYDAIDGSIMVSNGEYFRVLGRDAFLSRPEAEAALDGGGEDFPPEAGDPDVSMTQPDGSPWPF